ncbi:MAG TPA: helix-turn-helix domain-containing protein [Jatrophihabitans sp.]|nr:helix-turn-helix domain-containing protein [Jatrophihabitans sp.]
MTGGEEADGGFDELVSDVFARGCTSRAALEDIAGKWSVLALLALLEGDYRFNALRRRVAGVSEKMLSQTLQALERDGMVRRQVHSHIPPRVEYSLTPLGGRVARAVRALTEVLEASALEIAAAQAAYSQRT